MSLRIKMIAEAGNPEQYRITFTDDVGNETTIVCELSYFSGIGWGMNPVTKTDIFWRADGADSRQVLEAIVSFRAQRHHDEQ